MLGRVGRHPHIAPVLASCLQPPHCCIVQELAEQGSLWSLVHEKGRRFDNGRWAGVEDRRCLLPL